jgi:Zn-finger nucleic acid-binding protein
MTERQGIEIDYCPACRGVWLDRGELDKIIERSGADQAAVQPGFAPQQRDYPPQQRDYPPQQRDYPPQQHGYGHYKHKRRKSFLEELFD